MPRRDRFRKRRSPVARWAARILGLAGTAAVLAVGVVAGQMVLSTDEEGVVEPSRAATPEREAGGGGKGKARSGGRGGKGERKLSPEQREQRQRAVAELRGQGYAPVSLSAYEHDHLLRVLIGRPVGATPPGQRAFFFVDDEYIGMDATSPSGQVRPGRQLEREITLVYTLYEPRDRACCPKGGDERVHFRWNGESLVPREEIPPAERRMPPGS